MAISAPRSDANNCHEVFFSGKVVNNTKDGQPVVNMLGHSRRK
jgi:hypothetical protein